MSSVSTSFTESSQNAPAVRRGLLDFLLMGALIYAVYAMTPIGALGEYAFRAARGQKQRPNLFATFRGYDTHVELGEVDFSKSMLASKTFPPVVIAASEKTGVNKEILVSILLAFGECEGNDCKVKTPPYLEEILDGPTLDEECSLEHLAYGIDKAGKSLAPDAAQRVREELAVEALYISPFVLKQALLRANASHMQNGKEIDVHASLLPPGIRRGKLQSAMQVLAMHRLRTLAWPAERKWRISSPFGNRVHPVLGTKRFHNGTDLAVPTGTPMLSAHTAKVKRAGRDAVSGNYIKLDHGFGIETTYCHLSRVDVKTGERVERKEVVGKSGATGRITGPHLHYILRLQGEPVDAEQYGNAPSRRGGGRALPTPVEKKEKKREKKTKKAAEGKKRERKKKTLEEKGSAESENVDDNELPVKPQKMGIDQKESSKKSVSDKAPPAEKTKTEPKDKQMVEGVQATESGEEKKNEEKKNEEKKNEEKKNEEKKNEEKKNEEKKNEEKKN
ncbi:MAG: M23 family metallopeptidase, partial [Deltaproteobacteria bacterium]|nr:M23 family metallopeptidase [Deltaproteobacteria bacterium]